MEKYYKTFENQDSIDKDNNIVLWFFPPKTQNNYQINALTFQNQSFGEILNNENFPDPNFYYLGFIAPSFASKLKENYAKSSLTFFLKSVIEGKKKKNVSLSSNSINPYLNNSFTDKKTTLQNNFNKTSNKKNTWETENDKYPLIKDSEFFFDENSKLLSEIHNNIYRKKHHLLRKKYENIDGGTKKQGQNADHIKKRISMLRNKFFRTYSKEFKESLPENIYLNHLSVSAISSYNWRNQASKDRILRLTPEYPDENYDLSI